MKKNKILKKLLFVFLLIVTSPFIIVLTIVCVLLALIYLPFEKIIYKKYLFLGEYKPLITIRRRDEIKAHKQNKK